MNSEPMPGGTGTTVDNATSLEGYRTPPELGLLLHRVKKQWDEGLAKNPDVKQRVALGVEVAKTVKSDYLNSPERIAEGVTFLENNAQESEFERFVGGIISAEAAAEAIRQAETNEIEAAGGMKRDEPAAGSTVTEYPDVQDTASLDGNGSALNANGGAHTESNGSADSSVTVTEPKLFGELTRQQRTEARKALQKLNRGKAPHVRPLTPFATDKSAQDTTEPTGDTSASLDSAASDSGITSAVSREAESMLGTTPQNENGTTPASSITDHLARIAPVDEAKGITLAGSAAQRTEQQKSEQPTSTLDLITPAPKITDDKYRQNLMGDGPINMSTNHSAEAIGSTVPVNGLSQNKDVAESDEWKWGKMSSDQSANGPSTGSREPATPIKDTVSPKEVKKWENAKMAHALGTPFPKHDAENADAQREEYKQTELPVDMTALKEGGIEPATQESWDKAQDALLESMKVTTESAYRQASLPGWMATDDEVKAQVIKLQTKNSRVKPKIAAALVGAAAAAAGLIAMIGSPDHSSDVGQAEAASSVPASISAKVYEGETAVSPTYTAEVPAAPDRTSEEKQPESFSELMKRADSMGIPVTISEGSSISDALDSSTDAELHMSIPDFKERIFSKPKLLVGEFLANWNVMQQNWPDVTPEIMNTTITQALDGDATALATVQKWYSLEKSGQEIKFIPEHRLFTISEDLIAAFKRGDFSKAPAVSPTDTTAGTIEVGSDPGNLPPGGLPDADSSSVMTPPPSAPSTVEQKQNKGVRAYFSNLFGGGNDAN